MTPGANRSSLLAAMVPTSRRPRRHRKLRCLRLLSFFLSLVS
uniref:Uncharacterized protein n=1 Tax=Rhizophora mucronata TaxID=61149 RepID=A0A2P2J4I7_RHIMU